MTTIDRMKEEDMKETMVSSLPQDVLDQIENHIRDLKWRDIMKEMQMSFGFGLGTLYHNLDIGYTIRNFMEHWAVIPRFIHNNRVYGAYIRRNSGRHQLIYHPSL